MNADDQQFKRMKTVFGHANFREGNSTPVYNCKFDMEDKIIITGADDGYIASASNDGTLIIWDLKECKILHQRKEDHTSQVNKVEFFMIQSSKEQSKKYISSQIQFQNQKFQSQTQASDQFIQNQSMYQPSQFPSNDVFQTDRSQILDAEFINKKKLKENNQIQKLNTLKNENIQTSQELTPTYDQFLITCSDDGSMIIYDCSSIYQDSYDEFYTKDSEKNNKIFIPHSNIRNKLSKFKNFSDHSIKENQEIYSLQMIQELQEQFQQIQQRDLLAQKNFQNDLQQKQYNNNLKKTRKRIQTSINDIQVIDLENQRDPLFEQKRETGELFYVKLRPNNYRHGTRNKHIDSFSLCTKTGLIAGGTNQGEIYLWKIKFQSIRERQPSNCYDWIGVFKIHKKSIHQLKFSNNGEILFTGSGDGTAKLWKTNFKCLDDTLFPDINFYYENRYEEIDFVEQSDHLLHDFKILDHSQLQDDNDFIQQQRQQKDFQKKTIENVSNQNFQYEYQIDALEWSLKSRFAFCAISIKQKQNDQNENHPSSQITNLQIAIDDKKKQKPAIVKIQVYDTTTNKLLSSDLGKDCGYQKNIYNYACVMKAHPYDENIMLCCFDGGLVIIYDVRHMTIIQEIVEYGIYSIDQFVMNNQVDVDWSSDGDYIALSSFYGTLSLYSNLPHLKYKYLATRIHQFFNYDNEMHDHNPYETVEQQPSICGYELNPYEIQPSNQPIVGQFRKQFNKNMKIPQQQKNQVIQNIQQISNEFLRKQIFAIEFANEEEKFVSDQLNDGIKCGYFNTSVVSNESQASNVENQEIQAQILQQRRSFTRNQERRSPNQLQRNINRLQNQQRRVQSFMQLQQNNQNIISNYQNDIEEVKSEYNQDNEFQQNLLQHFENEDAIMHNESDNEVLGYEQNQLRQNRVQFAQNIGREDIIQTRQNQNGIQQRRRILLRNDELPEEIEDQLSDFKVQDQSNKNSQNQQIVNNQQKNDDFTNEFQSDQSFDDNDEIQGTRRRAKQRKYIDDDDSEMIIENNKKNNLSNKRLTRNNKANNFNNQIEEHSSQEESQYGYRKKLRRQNVNTNNRDLRTRQNKKLVLDDDTFEDKISGDDQESFNSNLQRKTRNGQNRTKQINWENDSSDRHKNRRSNRNNKSQEMENGRRRNERKRICMPRTYNGEDDESVFKVDHENNEEDNYSDEPEYDDENLSDGSSYNNFNRKRKNQQRLMKKYQVRRGTRISKEKYNGFDANHSSKKNQNEFDDNSNIYDSQVEQIITDCTFYQQENHVRDDLFSQRGSKNKKGSIYQKEGFFPKFNEKAIEKHFVLKEKQNQDKSQKTINTCGFCKRKMDQNCMIGPFIIEKTSMIKELQFSDEILKLIQQGEGLYFHQQCLELNQYVFYDETCQQWMNIRTALYNLVENKTYTCYRCIQPGATTQCYQCDRAFHGHFCNPQYMLPMDTQNIKFQCIMCRNTQNYHNYKSNKDFINNLNKLKGQQIDSIRKQIPKNHLLETQAYKGISWYFQPQINDEVIYFYQGHEKFYQSNNCFFYCGDKQQVNSSDLPWMKNNQIKNLPYGQVLCKVKNLEHKFNSLKSVNLINQYGDDSSDIIQESQIISFIDLEVIDPKFISDSKDPLSFIISIYPSQASQFIVPLNIYQKQLQLFQNLRQQNLLIGKRFKTFMNQKNINNTSQEVIIQEVSPIEPDSVQQSNWMSVVVSEVQQFNNSRNNRTKRGNQDIQEDQEMFRINFWDIILDQNEYQSLNMLGNKELIPIFDEFEKQRIIDGIRLFSEKNEEIKCFQERVTDSLAADYRSFVCCEMWIDLILERIRNSYYRSFEQLFYEIDLITQCSFIYNGENNEITLSAKMLTSKLKKELKNYINQNSSIKNKPSNQYMLYNDTNYKNDSQEKYGFVFQNHKNYADLQQQKCNNQFYQTQFAENNLQQPAKKQEADNNEEKQLIAKKGRLNLEKNNIDEDKDIIQIQVDFQEEDENFISESQMFKQGFNQNQGKSSVEIIDNGNVLIVDASQIYSKDNYENYFPKFNDSRAQQVSNQISQQHQDLKKKRGRPRKESTSSQINSHQIENQNSSMIDQQNNESRNYIKKNQFNISNQFENNQGSIKSQQQSNKMRVNGNIFKNEIQKTSQILLFDNKREEQKKKEKEINIEQQQSNFVGSILNFENSESALIDMNDKAIGQEGHYTVCSDQKSELEVQQKTENKMPNGQKLTFLGQKRMRNLVNDSSENIQDININHELYDGNDNSKFIDDFNSRNNKRQKIAHK